MQQNIDMILQGLMKCSLLTKASLHLFLQIAAISIHYVLCYKAELSWYDLWSLKYLLCASLQKTLLTLVWVFSWVTGKIGPSLLSDEHTKIHRFCAISEGVSSEIKWELHHKDQAGGRRSKQKAFTKVGRKYWSNLSFLD